MTAPLAGVKAIEFGHLIAGPGCTRVLAALGAEVIKVEPIGGEPMRSMNTWGQGIYADMNRGKQSICLDLRAPEGMAIARDLIAGADVVVQNLRPGALDALGLGADDVASLNPRAVYASVSGFGATGPHATRPGLDVAAQAESGLMALTGDPDRDPQRVGAPVVDVASSDLLALSVLAALLRRERTGIGGQVEVSLLETAYHLLSPIWAEYAVTGNEPRRNGTPQASVAPAADLVTVADGQIVLSAYGDGHWPRLCRAIDRPEWIDDERFATNPARVRNRPVMLEALAGALAHLDRDAAVDHLNAHGVVAGAVRSLADAGRSPQAEALELFRDLPRHDGDPLRLPRLPLRMAQWREGAPAVPASGRDTAHVLRQLGCSDTDIDRLVSDGVVTLPTPASLDAR